MKYAAKGVRSSGQQDRAQDRRERRRIEREREAMIAKARADKRQGVMR